MILTIILIAIIIIVGFLAYVFWKSIIELTKQLKEKDSLIESTLYNNRELRKELQKSN